MIETITNLGDAALLLPASFLLFCHLRWRGDSKRAMSLALVIAVCLTITILAKLAFLAVGVDCFYASVHSPSGHTSFSATFYGCCAALTTSDEAPLRRRFAWIAAVALVLAIAVSRVVVGAHNLAEVVIGLAIGLICVGLFLHLTRERAPTAGLPQFALGIVALAIVLQGTHLTLEPLLQTIADRLGFMATSRCSAQNDAAPLPRGALAYRHGTRTQA